MEDKVTKVAKITKLTEPKPKRLPKSQRKHVRRLKQEARNPSPVHS